ncbi:MAG: SRPBCC family protein [Bdellovibrionota bacterium]
MSHQQFVYVTYIRSTPEKVWEAFTAPEFTKQYWFGVTMECEWKKGSSWKMHLPDGTLADSGEILESDRPRKLVIKWQNEFKPEMKAEGYSRCTMTLEQGEGHVKMTILHEIEVEGDSMLIKGVSGGWPKVLSSLKSLLETGEALPEANKWPKGV